MNVAAEQISKAADRWLIACAGETPTAADVDAAVLACAGHLLVTFDGLNQADARDVALAAWSRIEGARTCCYVDLQISTPYLVFLVDPVAKTRHAFPVVDLVRMLGPRPVA